MVEGQTKYFEFLNFLKERYENKFEQNRISMLLIIIYVKCLILFTLMTGEAKLAAAKLASAFLQASSACLRAVVSFSSLRLTKVNKSI